jgi:hypothetical protein
MYQYSSSLADLPLEQLVIEGQEEDLKGNPLEGDLQKGEIGGRRTSVPCSAMCAPLLGIDGLIA